MRAPHGLAQLITRSGRVIERDTIVCNHDQRIVFVKPGSGTTIYLVHDEHGNWREEPGAFCRVCMAPICIECCTKGGCDVFERKLERSEARDRLRRQAAEIFV